MSNYKEQLLTEDWKYKRLKILKRDKFKCTVCGTNKNLQVHHTFYFKTFVSPWLYPDSSLLTACENCHKEFHMYNEIEIRDNITKKVKIKLNNKPKNKRKKRKYKHCKGLCLAEIQANRSNFKQDERGTWTRKTHILIKK